MHIDTVSEIAVANADKYIGRSRQQPHFKGLLPLFDKRSATVDACEVARLLGHFVALQLIVLCERVGLVETHLENVSVEVTFIYHPIHPGIMLLAIWVDRVAADGRQGHFVAIFEEHPVVNLSLVIGFWRLFDHESV